ncbi:MAG: cytochrome c oxidase subunit II, partial [Alphaproteobacteria bacterium]|nr:cytochrome c oxidase subunit II [Alphaproteobacteria bacterium]
MSFPIGLWPAAASHHARQVDWLIGAAGTLVWLLALPVFFVSLYFMLKYRRGKRADRSHAPRGSILIETSWSLVPFLLVLGFYVWSTYLYFGLQDPPANALTINVVAKQWMWKAQHPSGAAEIDALHVPANTPVKLVMTSQDVIHSLYLPALRIKQDVLPGRYTQEWFVADRTGTYPLRCAEFCGTDHSAMVGRLVIMEPDAYAAWQRQASLAGTLAAQGASLFREYGCSGCHAQGSSVHAPRLEGLYGSPVPLSDGRIVTADD